MPPQEINVVPLITAVGSLPHENRVSGLHRSLQLTPELYCIPQFPNANQFDQITLQPFVKLPENFTYQDGVFLGDRKCASNLIEALEMRPTLETLPGFSTAEMAMCMLEEQALRGVAPQIKKYQWVGPITLAHCILIEEKPVLLDPAMFSQLVEYLNSQLAFLANWCRKNRVDYLFLDEPCLPAIEKLPAETRQEVLTHLENCLRTIRAEGVFVGIHCCSELSPERLTWLWNRGVSLSVDVVRRETYLNHVVSLLEQNQLLFLGCVPTTASTSKEPQHNQLQLLSTIARLRTPDRKRIVLTPACGLATVPVATVPEVFSKLAAIRSQL